MQWKLGQIDRQKLKWLSSSWSFQRVQHYLNVTEWPQMFQKGQREQSILYVLRCVCVCIYILCSISDISEQIFSSFITFSYMLVKHRETTTTKKSALLHPSMNYMENIKWTHIAFKGTFSNLFCNNLWGSATEKFSLKIHFYKSIRFHASLFTSI